MGQMSRAGTRLVVSEADAWSLSAELTAGSVQDDTTDTQTLCRHTLTLLTCKSGSSLWIPARGTELTQWLCAAGEFCVCVCVHA